MALESRRVGAFGEDRVRGGGGARGSFLGTALNLHWSIRLLGTRRVQLALLGPFSSCTLDFDMKFKVF